MQFQPFASPSPSPTPTIPKSSYNAVNISGPAWAAGFTNIITNTGIIVVGILLSWGGWSEGQGEFVALVKDSAHTNPMAQVGQLLSANGTTEFSPANSSVYIPIENYISLGTIQIGASTTATTGNGDFLAAATVYWYGA